MRKIYLLSGIIIALISFSACAKSGTGEKPAVSDSENQSGSAEITEEATKAVSETETETVSEEKNMHTIEIAVGNQIFPAELYDNETARAFRERLPMTLDMSELNGNEKYYYLPDSLPVDSGVPSGIHAGDIMLYGDSCLVLFYESFSTVYSYTPIGNIENPEGLAAALGSGSAQVTFR